MGGVIVLAAILGAMPSATVRFGTVAFLALYGAALAIWLTIALAPRLRTAVLSFPAVALVAVVLRLMVFPAGPELSHDVQRYRWDGLVAASGLSPYAHPPDSPALAPLRTSWHALINHPEIRTIYPPAAQSIFAVWALAGGSLLAWRLLLLAFDLAILRMLGPRSALLWATCPLVTVEGFWSAHLEVVPAALLLAATCAVARRKELSGAIAAGLAIGMKIVPVAAVPALASFTSRRARFFALLALTLLLPVLPFLASGPLMPGFGDYARRWEFNAPLYESLEWLAGASDADVALKALWSSVKDSLGAEAISPFVYAQLHPERIARALCGLAFLAGLVAAMRIRSVEARVAWSVAALLLCAPALHPWYWITLLPVALEARSRLLVALAAVSPASYLLYTGLPAVAPLAAAATYLLPLVATLAFRRTMTSSRAAAAGERPGSG
ncbi:MAG: hypothetical protein NDJ92_04180 [Thermoanaerobaculia bacterium]|nr:hypothetical protein [Thermoanaerobaculia bacterium]